MEFLMYVSCQVEERGTSPVRQLPGGGAWSFSCTSAARWRSVELLLYVSCQVEEHGASPVCQVDGHEAVFHLTDQHKYSCSLSLVE